MKYIYETDLFSLVNSAKEKGELKSEQEILKESYEHGFIEMFNLFLSKVRLDLPNYIEYKDITDRIRLIQKYLEVQFKGGNKHYIPTDDYTLIKKLVFTPEDNIETPTTKQILERVQSLTITRDNFRKYLSNTIKVLDKFFEEQEFEDEIIPSKLSSDDNFYWKSVLGFEGYPYLLYRDNHISKYPSIVTGTYDKRFRYDPSYSIFTGSSGNRKAYGSNPQSKIKLLDSVKKEEDISEDVISNIGYTTYGSNGITKESFDKFLTLTRIILNSEDITQCNTGLELNPFLSVNQAKEVKTLFSIFGFNENQLNWLSYDDKLQVKSFYNTVKLKLSSTQVQIVRGWISKSMGYGSMSIGSGYYKIRFNIGLKRFNKINGTFTESARCLNSLYTLAYEFKMLEELENLETKSDNNYAEVEIDEDGNIYKRTSDLKTTDTFQALDCDIEYCIHGHFRLNIYLDKEKWDSLSKQKVNVSKVKIAEASDFNVGGSLHYALDGLSSQDITDLKAEMIGNSPVIDEDGNYIFEEDSEEEKTIDYTKHLLSLKPMLVYDDIVTKEKSSVELKGLNFTNQIVKKNKINPFYSGGNIEFEGVEIEGVSLIDCYRFIADDPDIHTIDWSGTFNLVFS